MLRFLSVIILAILLAPECLGRMKLKMKYLSTKALKGQKVEIAAANFGNLPWGSAITGHLYSTDPDDACKRLKRIEFVEDDTAPIFVAKKGACSFAMQANHAQSRGAKMLIVILENSHIDKDDAQMDPEEYNLKSNVNIPVGYMQSSDGKKLLETMNNKSTGKVSASIRFDLERLEKVKLDLWLSVDDRQSYDFVNHIMKRGGKLTPKLNISAHFALRECSSCRHKGFTKAKEGCYSNGQFCPLNDFERSNRSAMNVLDETLRQKCMSKLSGAEWIHYAKDYGENCLVGRKLEDNAECRTMWMAHVHAVLSNKSNDFSRCVKDSWEPLREGDKSVNTSTYNNSELRANMNLQKKLGVTTVPTLFINDVLYTDKLDEANVLFAICRGFLKKDPACEEILKEGRPKEKKILDASGQSWAFAKFTLTLIVVLVAFMAVFFYVYRRIVRRSLMKEMNEEVQASVASYLKMNPTQRA